MRENTATVRLIAANDAPASIGVRLDETIDRTTEGLLRFRQDDGHWVFELEADATIPSEYILLKHFLGEMPDAEVAAKIGAYLRRNQGEDGGWPLFHGGALDTSATVKAYFALKMIGDPVDAPHMARARAAVLARGGAAKTNVFTRIQLALYGAVPWRAVPVMPVEIMNLPRWFPFHLDKVSYWSRTVIVPLLVLMALRPRAKNPLGVGVDELFATPPNQIRDWYHPKPKGFWGVTFRMLDRVLQRSGWVFPTAGRKRAIAKAVAFVTERLNGEDGLGAIYPAMANTVMMFDALGYRDDHPDFVIAKRAIEKLLVVKDDEAYCQPCLSPIWDTGLVAHALAEVGGPVLATLQPAGDWLAERQILDVVGDWASRRPNARPGGWAFQYANPHYPDLDDTAMVVMALDRTDARRYKPNIDRAVEWVLGLQCENGGWAAFDADNEHYHLNAIPFADHGALLDPPTADVTARCLGMLCQLGFNRHHSAVARAVDYLLAEQEDCGAWFGRWGTNYIYGTWSVLCALNVAELGHDHPAMRRAVTWLISQQRPDGGWGESGDSYYPEAGPGAGSHSTPSQTAWAILGLMAGGAIDHPAVSRGISWLQAHQGADGLWNEPDYTAVGFPRVFYLRYHGYAKFFPLWALARFRALKAGNAKAPLYGM